MFNVSNLTVSVEDKEILKNFSIDVGPGEVHAIMGPNGSGKSTLAHVCAGKEDYTVLNGEVLLNDENLLDLDPDERSTRGLFLAFQYPIEIPGVTTMTFLKSSLEAHYKANGKEVYLVSGGFRQMIDPVAKELGIPSENVQANTLTFNEDGSFKGYDPREFTSIAGGKADAVKHIKGSKGYKSMVMVGDGATDVEARTPGGADMVIGYGGAQRRARVEAEADWYVLNLFDLVNVF